MAMTHPNFDPVAFSIGPVKVHWYGIMYLIGFAAAWWLGRYRTRKPHSPLKPEELDDLIFYGALGVILGGRIGYILFYNFAAFVENPSIIFKVWEGGMSFHGGFLGVLAACWFFARKQQMPFFVLMDFVAPLTPIGLGAGRLGNFINGELWGKVSDVPWAMTFATGGPEPRHPSQLYEFFLEGVVLFVLLWWFSSKPRPTMAVSGLFSLGYGAFRFLVEFVREPDAHIGYLAFGWVTKGQVLSLPMIVLGILLIALAYRGGARGSQ